MNCLLSPIWITFPSLGFRHLTLVIRTRDRTINPFSEGFKRAEERSVTAIGVIQPSVLLPTKGNLLSTQAGRVSLWRAITSELQPISTDKDSREKSSVVTSAEVVYRANPRWPLNINPFLTPTPKSVDIRYAVRCNGIPRAWPTSHGSVRGGRLPVLASSQRTSGGAASSEPVLAALSV